MKLLKSLLLTTIYAIRVLSISNGYAQPEKNNPAVISMPGRSSGCVGLYVWIRHQTRNFLPRLRKMV